MKFIKVGENYQEKGILGLLPIEWAISDDFPSAGMLAAKDRSTREGPRGRIPPMAGHNEALGLSSVRVGKWFGCPDRKWHSVFRKGFGDRCLAEAGQPL